MHFRGGDRLCQWSAFQAPPDYLSKPVCVFVTDRQPYHSGLRIPGAPYSLNRHQYRMVITQGRNKPNFGINTIAPKIGLQYNFYEPIKFRRREVPEFNPYNEWLISGFGGVKNLIFDSVNIDIIEKYEGAFFPVFGVSSGYNRQVSYMSKIGIGVTLSYDGSMNAQAAVENNELDPVDTPFSDKIQLSIYPSYELTVNRLSLVLQPAFYLYRKKFRNQSPAFHQRIGLKYQITDKIFAGIILRDYAFHVSDHLEWTLGYRIITK